METAGGRMPGDVRRQAKGTGVMKRIGLVGIALLWLCHCGKEAEDTGSSAGAVNMGTAGDTPPATGDGENAAGQPAPPSTPPDGSAGNGSTMASPTMGPGSDATAPKTPGAGNDAPPTSMNEDAEPPSGSTPDAGPDPSVADAGLDPAPAEPSSGFPSAANPGEDGPYEAITKQNTGPSGGYTLYHPAELGPNGVLHPIITWGNGATTTPPLFPMLPHLATHGFVVIASNNAFVTGGELRAGLDWLEAENDRMGSDLHGKLDVARAASMGYSLGSLGSFEIAADPRLKTTVHISGGAMNKSVVPNLKNPAAFLCGNSSDIAYTNCESDFDLATVPVFYGVFDGDHLGILLSHADLISHAATGWLRWHLMDDTVHEALFVGPDCTLCQSGSGWTVKQKDL